MGTSTENYRNPNADVEQRVRAAGAQIGNKASELASMAGDQIESAVHSAEGVAKSAVEQGREAGERVQQVAGNMKTAVDKSVREQPMATLAVAAALGFVIGALWKS